MSTSEGIDQRTFVMIVKEGARGEKRRWRIMVDDVVRGLVERLGIDDFELDEVHMDGVTIGGLVDHLPNLRGAHLGDDHDGLEPRAILQRRDDGIAGGVVVLEQREFAVHRDVVEVGVRGVDARRVLQAAQHFPHERAVVGGAKRPRLHHELHHGVGLRGREVGVAIWERRRGGVVEVNY